MTLWSRGRRLYVLLFLGIDTFWGFPSRAQFYKSTIRCLGVGKFEQMVQYHLLVLTVRALILGIG